MRNTGQLPALGTPVERVVSMDYTTCIVRLNLIVNSIKPNYPSKTLVSTNLMRSEQVWTNNAVAIVTCDAVGNRMVFATAPYL